jgi:hypothetical protein
LTVNANVAVRWRVVASGLDVRTGAGGVLTVHVYEVVGEFAAGALERARTLNVCCPYESPLTFLGLLHRLHVTVWSTAHWYDVAPAAVNSNLAFTEFDGFVGATVIVGAGGAAARAAAAGVAAPAGESVTAVLA